MTIVIVMVATIAILVSVAVTWLLCKKKYNRPSSKCFGKWDIKIAEKLMQASPDAIYLIDREHRMRDVLNYDPKEIPLSLNELVGKLAYEYMDEENTKVVAGVIDQTFETDETLIAHYSASTDTQKIYYEGRFKRINNDWIICISHDLTSTYLYEQKLIHSKEQLEEAQKVNKLILDSTNCGLVYIDTDFVVQFENLHVISKDGFNLNYKKNQYCFQQLGRTKLCEECIAQKALKTRKVEKGELLLNEQLHLEVTATPVFAPNGNGLGVVLKYEDITIREQFARDLQRAKETAEASDKLKSQFLSNMSHEIRTPLNAIVGFSDLLAITNDETEKEEYVSIIKKNNVLLLQLINDILDLSRIESDKLEFVYKNISVNSMLTVLEASSSLRLAANPHVNITFNAPSTDCMLYTEENRVLQVLANFVNNAIKFTKKGVIEIKYEVQEEAVRFSVSDTGIGIPLDKQADVFKRFIKLDEFANGTGLGLSICASIINRLNGNIGVESVVGEGSTFWFTLPLTPQELY